MKDDMIFSKFVDENNKYQAIKNNSLKNRAVKKSNRKKKVSKEIIVAALAFAIGCYISPKVKTSINNFVEQGKMHENINEMLNYENNSPDIITHNTYRTDDFNAYFFDNGGIAKDILSLDDKCFDTNLYMAYLQMGHDRVNGGYHNWDVVINCLNAYVNQEISPLAFARVNGCKTFEEYLEKNGFSSEEEFVKYSQSIMAHNNEIMEYELGMEDMYGERDSYHR